MNLKIFVAGLALVTLLGGCSEKTQQQVEDTSKAVVTDVKEGASEAVEATKEAAAVAETTAAVKAALLASNKMDTKALNVDTVEGTVHLKGHVPTEEQRALAEEIAKSTVAEGTNVVNELVVGEPTATPAAEGTPVAGETPVATGTPAGDHDGHDHDHDHADHNH